MFLITISRKAQWKKTTTAKGSKGVRSKNHLKFVGSNVFHQLGFFSRKQLLSGQKHLTVVDHQ